MALNPKNWKLTAYTLSTWTNVVAEVATLATIMVINNDLVNGVDVSLRLSGGLVILPPTTIEPGNSYTVDIRSLNIMSGEQLQAFCTAANVHVLGSGVSYT